MLREAREGFFSFSFLLVVIIHLNGNQTWGIQTEGKREIGNQSVKNFSPDITNWVPVAACSKTCKKILLVEHLETIFLFFNETVSISEGSFCWGQWNKVLLFFEITSEIFVVIYIWCMEICPLCQQAITVVLLGWSQSTSTSVSSCLVFVLLDRMSHVSPVHQASCCSTQLFSIVSSASWPASQAGPC